MIFYEPNLLINVVNAHGCDFDLLHMIFAHNFAKDANEKGTNGIVFVCLD